MQTSLLSKLKQGALFIDVRVSVSTNNWPYFSSPSIVKIAIYRCLPIRRSLANTLVFGICCEYPL